MDHEPAHIATIAIGLTAVFAGGLVARRAGYRVIDPLGARLRGTWLGRAPLLPAELAGS